MNHVVNFDQNNFLKRPNIVFYTHVISKTNEKRMCLQFAYRFRKNDNVSVTFNF